MLSGLFESAIEDEIINANPCQNAGKHCGNDTVVEIEPLTASEVQITLDNASNLPLEVHTFYPGALPQRIRLGFEAVTLTSMDIACTIQIGWIPMVFSSIT